MTPDLLETHHRKTSALVRLSRPWFWPLGWAGAYLGSVLATRSWIPPAGAWPASAAAFLVLGPLVWTAVLTVNDLHDLPSDRVNPRKATAPLVTGALTAGELTRWCWSSSVAAVLVAAVAGVGFAAGTVVVLVLGWLYSAPPVRLKGRPGADVAVNALVIGVFAPAAGWSLHRPAGEYPPILALLGLLLVAALYLPTTVLDRDADVRAGDRTAAVRWRPESCYRAGLALWTAATALWLACCHLGVLVERDSWWFQNATAPGLIAIYAIAARRPSIPRMAVVAIAFAVPATDFLIAVVRAG
jgi:lycopene elongase/hydratase (dihydrobisanhydrobacterioruberin-forming)